MQLGPNLPQKLPERPKMWLLKTPEQPKEAGAMLIYFRDNIFFFHSMICSTWSSNHVGVTFGSYHAQPFHSLSRTSFFFTGTGRRLGRLTYTPTAAPSAWFPTSVKARTWRTTLPHPCQCWSRQVRQDPDCVGPSSVLHAQAEASSASSWRSTGFPCPQSGQCHCPQAGPWCLSARAVGSSCGHL